MGEHPLHVVLCKVIGQYQKPLGPARFYSDLPFPQLSAKSGLFPFCAQYLLGVPQLFDLPADLFFLGGRYFKKAGGCGRFAVRCNLIDAHVQLLEHADVFKIQALGGVVKAVTVFSLCPRAEKADVIIVVQRALVHPVQLCKLGRCQAFKTFLHLCSSPC